jgi:hypothetical protein
MDWTKVIREETKNILTIFFLRPLVPHRLIVHPHAPYWKSRLNAKVDTNLNQDQDQVQCTVRSCQDSLLTDPSHQRQDDAKQAQNDARREKEPGIKGTPMRIASSSVSGLSGSANGEGAAIYKVQRFTQFSSVSYQSANMT